MGRDEEVGGRGWGKKERDGVGAGERGWGKGKDCTPHFYIRILVYEPTWNPLFQQDVVSVCFDRSGTRVLTLQRQLPPTVFNIWEGKALYQLADDTRSYRNSVTMKTGCFLGHSDEVNTTAAYTRVHGTFYGKMGLVDLYI